MSNSGNRLGVTPACLSSLAIYNPSFGTSEESLDEQIVYYHSKEDGERTGRRSASNGDPEQENKERNERLRQIGLAQGMVEFAKGFSGGEAVDSIETEKCRIILHELELGWWILASIDLTCITSVSEKSTNEQPRSTKEYSSREVASPALLLQQLLRAHRTFLLHHSASLGELYIRMERSKFCKLLKRYWNHFICRWDVLLNGNPALGLFNGLKLAAGGELGVGVGEEEWGSGEREVLEAFIGRTEGLVDMVVSRFGDAPAPLTSHSNPTTVTAQTQSAFSSSWQANGAHPRPSDGVIFSGIGTITRTSVRDVSCWAEDLFRYGQDTYGVRDNPSSARWRRRRKPSIERNLSQPQESPTHESPGTSDPLDTRKRTSSSVRQQSLKGHGIPRSLINTDTGVSQAASSKPSENPPVPKEQNPENEESPSNVTETGTETMMKYLTLGVYGSKWGIPFKRPPENPKISKLREDERAKSDSSGRGSSSSRSVKVLDDMPGYYLIGFQGDLEGTVEEDERDEETWEERALRLSDESQSSRTMIRTLHVQRIKPKEITGSSSSIITIKENSSLVEPYSDKLRVVVYVQEPFMFICLFELQTDALAISTFYRSIHHQLGPLQPPLLISTAPNNASARLWEASLPKSTASTQSSQPIGDLVFDPTKLTIHTTIPNIPDPESLKTEINTSDTAPWSRIEALSVYSQILSTYESTRRRSSELERTCKTSRGWWVVWMRLPEPTEPSNSSLYREAFLIRKASDYTAPKARNVSARFGRDVTSTNAGWGPGKLAEGIGIDTRQYIEGLLTLNR